ncbi:MAG: GNAT family N-acetyltransferase [Candidatus Omnitrophica bacterium]|nr:GNAT family N-acetyltransferase [Candidatus Omnitrophota bacterium]MBU4333374.1 GNAT family N-acetyltransferase [Candidatus Omnitrophota bacterium]
MEADRIIITQASLEDADFIIKFGTETFQDAYGHAHSKEDMNAYLLSAFNKEKTLDELCDNNIVYLIASIEGKPIAYSKLSTSKAHRSLKECSSIELERIYVAKEMTGKKIGSTLMKKSLDIARERNYKTLWLAVWEFNPLAVAFYERFGFKSFGSDIFTLGKTKRNLILMKKEL